MAREKQREYIRVKESCRLTKIEEGRERERANKKIREREGE